MAYKYKPNKGMKKRLRVSGTGKVKHNHSFTSHLRSSRSSKRIRKLRRASVLFEGHAKNMREFMGMKGIRQNQIRIHVSEPSNSLEMYASNPEPRASGNVAWRMPRKFAISTPTGSVN